MGAEDKYYDRCAELKALTSNPDWDDYGAAPLDPRVLDDARHLAGALDDIYGEARISAASDGSVHLNYTLPGDDWLCIEVRRSHGA